jgi:hypothetical protein
MPYLLRRVVAVLGSVLLAMLLLCAKVTYEAHQTFARGEEALAQGAYSAAVTYYERTLKWYTPYSTRVPLAIERLWHLGSTAEARGDRPLALAAYGAIRSGLYAVQSLYLPYAAWIPKSEERLAVLMAQTKHAAETPATQLAQDTGRFAAMLQHNAGPHTGWSVLVELAFLGWAGATVGFIWYSFPVPGGFSRPRGLLWGSLMALCFGVWIVAMVQT